MYRIVILISAFLLSVAGMLYVQGADRRDTSNLIASLDPASLKGVAQLSAPANQPLPDMPSTGATALAAAVAATSARPDDSANDEQMAAMTASVIAAIGLVRNQAGSSGDTLQGLVAQALSHSQSDAYTDAMVAEAKAGTPEAPAPLPQTAVVSADGARYYTVEPGDSLASIAIRFFGSASDLTRIFEANRAQIVDPEKIRVGQTLRIPD